MDSNLSGLLHTSLVVCFSFIYFIFYFFCFSFIFDPPSCLLSFCFFAVIYFLFYAKMRHLTRNIQIYAHAQGKEPAYYLWDLDQRLPDCLQHFVRLSVSPVVWQRVSPLRKAFPSPCLVYQLLTSDWRSQLTLRWSSPPSPCQGSRWNERNRNQ